MGGDGSKQDGRKGEKERAGVTGRRRKKKEGEGGARTSRRRSTKPAHLLRSLCSCVVSCYVFSEREFTFIFANVNSRSRSLYAIARLSVVCIARAPYSGGSNF